MFAQAYTLIVHLEHLPAPSRPHLAKQHTPKHTTPCSRLLLLLLLWAMYQLLYATQCRKQCSQRGLKSQRLKKLLLLLLPGSTPTDCRCCW
jgi:hypothetical protein